MSDDKSKISQSSHKSQKWQISLVGNPNSGKTTLFNRLTGSHQRVGNWPGVTVEKKTGYCPFTQKEIRLEITDLPGIYSLEPRSTEETIAYDHIVNNTPDLVVDIVDATNLERNLFLTLQLKSHNVPTVVALNMMDEVRKNGDKIDVDKLSAMLNMPVVPISALSGSGFLSQIMRRLGKNVDDGGIGNLTSRIVQEVCGSGCGCGCVEVSDGSSKECKSPLEVSVSVDSTPEKMYSEIDKIIKECLVRGVNKNIDRSFKIDKILTNKWLGIPIFLAIMYLVFQISFGDASSAITEFIEGLADETVPQLVESWLTSLDSPEWIISLVNDGIVAGVGAVLSFLPQIFFLFLFLTLLEDTGYMARAAFIMDRLFKQVGLSGKSFIPMLMGFGCSVPAVMAARTLEDENDRKTTIIITPFMSCGARLPIYALFVGVFFAKTNIELFGYSFSSGGVVMMSIYLLGVLVAVFSALLFKKTILKGDGTPFVMELPPYRVPGFTSTIMHLWEKVSGFVIRAGTIIFAMSILIWLCQSYDFTFTAVEDNAESIFGVVGHWIAPIFEPLGFGDWRAAVALLTGFIAKEAVVSTMEILYTAQDFEAFFTPLTAYAFMVFTLLYLPCLAALAAMKQELNSWKWTIFALLYQTGVAYGAAFIVFRVGHLLGFS